MDEKNTNLSNIYMFLNAILFISLVTILIFNFIFYQTIDLRNNKSIIFSIVQFYTIPVPGSQNSNQNSNSQKNDRNGQIYNQNLNGRPDNEINRYNGINNRFNNDSRYSHHHHSNQTQNGQPNNNTEHNQHLSMKDVLLNSELSEKEFHLLPQETQERIMNDIIKIDIREPFYPVDQSCRVPQLIKYTEQMCEAAGPAFTGKLRKAQPKMAHIINFAFEIDVLEIHLNELYPVVDKIFICEAAFIHGKSGLHKPCVWDMIKDQPRFSKFKDKVVLLFITESEIGRYSMRFNEWAVEFKMEDLRWRKFLQWNQINNFFEDDDVVGFGDADEIASIYNLNLIKQCETKTITDVGIWFTRGRITEKVKTDWPVKNESFALGDPSFFTIHQAKIFPRSLPKCYGHCNYPGRTRGFAPNFVLGGLHLSSYKYMPQYILKLISMTERQITEIDEFNRIMAKITNGDDIQEIQRDIALKKFAHKMGGNIMEMNLTEIGTRQYILPWFLECNKNRYSTFFLNILDEPRLN